MLEKTSLKTCDIYDLVPDQVSTTKIEIKFDYIS